MLAEKHPQALLMFPCWPHVPTPTYGLVIKITPKSTVWGSVQQFGKLSTTLRLKPADFCTMPHHLHSGGTKKKKKSPLVVFRYPHHEL